MEESLIPLARWRGVARALVVAGSAWWFAVGPVSAQLPASPSLRWGSGYLDVPTASVLPGSGVRTAFSGFWSSVPAPPVVDETGAVVGTGPSRDAFHGDLSLSLGLLDRFEVGLSLQSFQADRDGGDLWGAFGKFLLLKPDPGGLGLAVGARILNRPGLPGGVEGAPARLGFGDPRLRRRYEGGIEVETRFTPWAAGTFALPGPRVRGLPESDVTLTVGWGGGTFREGEELEWYGEGGSGGWFAGASWGFALGPAATLGLQGEYSGFDLNAGAELAWRGARVGVHALGLNHDESVSVYRSRRWGFSVALEACPLLRRACRPRVRRAPADTVRLPAPPPDTVRVRAPDDDTVRVPAPPTPSAPGGVAAAVDTGEGTGRRGGLLRAADVGEPGGWGGEGGRPGPAARLEPRGRSVTRRVRATGWPSPAPGSASPGRRWRRPG